MIDLLLAFEYLAIALFAGLIGALVGIGGGIILVPILVLVFDLPFHVAVGASITAVVATSITSTSSYIRNGLVNIRLGLFLEIGTAFGALSGAILAIYLKEDILFVIFSIVLVYAAYAMYASSKKSEISQLALKNDFLAEKLHLQAKYINLDNEPVSNEDYFVENTPAIFGISIGAGIASGLLGVGGGFIKVPALVKISKLPMKSASATSNFMIGVTAGTSALVYLAAGYIDPIVAIPVSLGAVFGASIGVRLLKHIPGNEIRVLFAILLIFVAVQMFLEGVGLYL